MRRRRGYTESISVRRPYRRRGLARALIAQSLHAVKERGMEEAALGVQTENIHGAFRLYESMGLPGGAELDHPAQAARLGDGPRPPPGRRPPGKISAIGITCEGRA